MIVFFGECKDGRHVDIKYENHWIILIFQNATMQQHSSLPCSFEQHKVNKSFHDRTTLDLVMTEHGRLAGIAGDHSGHLQGSDHLCLGAFHVFCF